MSLYKCKSLAGISQDHTSVNYAQFIRDIMTQKMAYHLNHIKLAGIIEIDETAFGVIQKYGRGLDLDPWFDRTSIKQTLFISNNE